MISKRSAIFCASLFGLLACTDPGTAGSGKQNSGHSTVRLATYNVSLSDNTDQPLITKLEEGHAGARNAAAVIQNVRPEILVLNEFDYDEELTALRRFQSDYLEESQAGQSPIHYAHVYAGPVNTGVPSGLDLDMDGQAGEPEDAYGFGRYPGQYGMALLSQFPLDRGQIRSFQRFLWTDMPGAQLPQTSVGQGDDSMRSFYPKTVEAKMRLSSKSHWDIPVLVNDVTLHALLAHPTPPAFDGPEDRNGHRNRDEIRLLHDYLAGEDYMIDDQGQRGGLAPGTLFFAAGDFNADPNDGGSRGGAIGRLLNSQLISQYGPPSSAGGAAAATAQQGANLNHRGNPAYDTADFSDGRVGNLRVDYVLPGENLTVASSGVFWPAPGQTGSSWIDSSDHRLVWVDVKIPEASSQSK